MYKRQAEADSWWLAPVGVAEPARDELVIKLALAIATPTVDPYAVIQTQRGATMRHLQELTRLKVALTAPLTAPPATIGVDPELLVLEHRLFAVEAQLRWLDHAEASLAANPAARHTHPATPTTQSAPISGTTTRATAPPISHPAHTVPTGGTP